MPSDTPPQSLPLEIGDDCIDAVHVHVIPARLTPCPYAEYRLRLSRPLAHHHIRYNALYINDLHLMTRRQRPIVPAQLNFKKQRDALTRLPLGERFEHIIRTNLWAAGSKSGLGSELGATAHLRSVLPADRRRRQWPELGRRTVHQ